MISMKRIKIFLRVHNAPLESMTANTILQNAIHTSKNRAKNRSLEEIIDHYNDEI